MFYCSFDINSQIGHLAVQTCARWKNQSTKIKHATTTSVLIPFVLYGQGGTLLFFNFVSPEEPNHHQFKSLCQQLCHHPFPTT